MGDRTSLGKISDRLTENFCSPERLDLKIGLTQTKRCRGNAPRSLLPLGGTV
ncbi:hypothetical protein [Nostoc sp. TCL240-02]|uniref:hypothetical protein n=1 Tax=Nostoc sp. TCL240-02 TaxID=2572090 RepID=UPI00157F984C|nr:hypothetical protein [Nostoc sp. TCL240-02]